MAIEYKDIPKRTSLRDKVSISNTIDAANPNSTEQARDDLAYQRAKERDDLAYARSLYGQDDAAGDRQKAIDSLARQFELANDQYGRTIEALHNVPRPEFMQMAAQRDVRGGASPQMASMYSGQGGISNKITGKIDPGILANDRVANYGNNLAKYAAGFSYDALNNAYLDSFGIPGTQYPGYVNNMPKGRVPVPYYVDQSSYGNGYQNPYASMPAYSGGGNSGGTIYHNQQTLRV